MESRDFLGGALVRAAARGSGVAVKSRLRSYSASRRRRAGALDRDGTGIAHRLLGHRSAGRIDIVGAVAKMRGDRGIVHHAGPEFLGVLVPETGPDHLDSRTGYRGGVAG